MPNFKELTVAEYMDLVQGEGLLVKSMAGLTMAHDAIGSHIASMKEKKNETSDENASDEPDDEEDADVWNKRLADEHIPEDEESEDNDDKEDKEPTEFVLTISTNEPDRINDVLNPMGCETKSFANNPLFLYEHGASKNGPMSDPDAVLGQIRSLTMDPETKSIRVIAKYCPREGNRLVDKILDMERKGLIPGNSMGWMPLGGIRLHDDGRRTVDKWELLEVSKVLVPVNSAALRYNNQRAPNARTAD